MPKSKRAKVVSLTKTKKKGKESKQELIKDIGQSLLKYNTIFVLYPQNQRNNRLKELRLQFRSSRFYFGKNKVIRKAFELHSGQKEGLDKFCQAIVGNCGLLFTNEPVEKMKAFFQTYSVQDYPRTGFVATKDVSIPTGILEHYPASLELRFRSLGVPTKLTNGQIEVLGDFSVCREGEVLSPDQARLLILLEEKMSQFRIQLLCSWTSEKGYEDLTSPIPS
eukprot:TRINITY_DN8737_c0_g1_i4.p1 TRINITY_DN8737_c0_g1~~TRINITY_DN8737_c0_g1_i4.p1  ORF type:complete len:222 (-),score=29.13 TRINITY_DN8737_c0_g1_i4:256-921(-)